MLLVRDEVWDGVGRFICDLYPWLKIAFEISLLKSLQPHSPILGEKEAQTDIGQMARTVKESQHHLHLLHNIKEMKFQTQSWSGLSAVPGSLPCPKYSPFRFSSSWRTLSLCFSYCCFVCRILVFLATFSCSPIHSCL